MLKKLMKYEFRATGRVFLPLFAVLIIIAGVNRLLISLGLQTPGTIGIVISVILIVGIFVLTIILTIQRFRQNLLSNEGYLMMTLPVKTDSLILSKLFVSAVWAVASFVIAMLAITIMAATKDSWYEISSSIRWFGEHLAINAPRTIAYTIEAIIIIAIMVLLWALILYACMSLSMLVNKRRGLFTFGAFIVITTAIQIVMAVISSILGALNVISALERVFGPIDTFGGSQFTIASMLVCQLILCAIFYAITRYMLKNKLNLQQ